MSDAEFEFTIYLAAEPTEDQYGLIATRHDDIITGRHGDISVAGFLREAPYQIAAIESALHDLRALGLTPVRIEL